jgi:hypothetical protein
VKSKFKQNCKWLIFQILRSDRPKMSLTHYQ